MSEPEPTVVHAYGLLDAGSAPPPWDGGIDGAQVFVVRVGRVAALVSRLSAERYGAAAWQAHAEDPQWLERVAREHHAVLQTVVATSDVLPLRLPGIYDDVS